MQGNRQLEALFVARPIEKREMAGHESRNVAVLARHGFDRRQVISRSAREAVDGDPFSAHAGVLDRDALSGIVDLGWWRCPAHAHKNILLRRLLRSAARIASRIVAIRSERPPDRQTPVDLRHFAKPDVAG